MSEDVVMRERIACELLGIAALEPGGFAPCPGMRHHSKGNGPRDFRVMLEGAPTGFCFHGSCADEVEAFNLELRRRIWKAENGLRRPPPMSWGIVTAEPRVDPLPKRPKYDLRQLERVAGNVNERIDREWLMAASPLPVAPGSQGVAPDFLEALYEPREVVLVFTKFESQGQFAYEVGVGGWRLSPDRRGEKVRSELPTGGPDGVWYLCNPVHGGWRANNAGRAFNGFSKWGRRHGDCVTAWRYLVLESDEAPVDLWLKILVQLDLPICAIYTSGGRSVHGLVRLDATCKMQWDVMRNVILQSVARLGADPAAMTAVRLTRLPGCLRGVNGRLQELWYLNPHPNAGETILSVGRRR